MPGSPLRPLYSGVTWRRWAFMILGGMVSFPYLFMAMVVGGTVDEAGGSALLPMGTFFAVLAAGLFVTGLMPVVRRLECSISLEMLGAPEQPGQDTRWPARLRAAVWFTVHVAVGGAVGALSVLVPLLCGWVFTRPFAARAPSGPKSEIPQMSGVPQGWEGMWVIPLGIVPLLVLVYGMALLGSLAVKGAAWALGPSPEERIAAAERRADAQAERTRLARELHDSVGHALSIVTVQSAAAARVLERDTEFARQALQAIEESARTALEDLDHVLGLLREEEGGGKRTPQRTLHDLEDLLGKTGLEIDLRRTGDLDRLPAAVSREAYRIVQEGLTNVAKHAGRVPVELRLAIGPCGLDLELSNPMGARTHGGGTGGRGLAGLGERVHVLRGTLSAEADRDRWRLRASIPIPKGST
ncbi:sensor histidine kinase [Actinocorallia populi]|uniref:sensor histidine kinase n=1 Tax=Actinocorallia populi TaxID=2079200 RepID=UPI001E39A648|nr:histidine kinase [Actinocorallia populi]